MRCPAPSPRRGPLVLAWLALTGCSPAPTPSDLTRGSESGPRGHAPAVRQGRPPEADPAGAEAVDQVEVGLRTGRTRVGEAVRLHVSAWRASGGPALAPTVELIGPATVERVGGELLDERDGRVRERIDFLIEPSGAGTIDLTVLTAPAQPEPPGAEGPTLPAERREALTLIVAEALTPAQLEAELGSQAGRLERGRRLTRQGDYARALEAYQRALSEAPDDPIVLGELGWAAFLADDPGLARRATREGLRHQTDPAARGALLYNLGRIAEARGRTDEAIAAYRRSLVVRPGSAPVEARLRALGAELAPPDPSARGAAGLRASAPLDAIGACEQIEEDGCPLFHQRGACRCVAEQLAELEPIGAWRLLTLTEPDAGGLNQVFFLLFEPAQATPPSDAEPRYQVLGPLPGSHFHGDLRGGVRSAAEVGPVLRVDFEGTVAARSLPAVDGEEPARLLRRWSLVCSAQAPGPRCATWLTGFGWIDGAPYDATIEIDAAGVARQTRASGPAPSPAELTLDFPVF